MPAALGGLECIRKFVVLVTVSILLSLPAFSVQGDASNYLLGTQSVYLGAYWCPSCASSGAVVTILKSNLNVTLPVVMYTVFHNTIGQTAYITSISTDAGLYYYSTNTMTMPVLSHGMYNVSVFAVTPSGIPVSRTVTVTFNL